MIIIRQKYQPKQIPDLLDQSFQDYVSYQEIPSTNPQVMTYYYITTIKEININIINYILPDGCIDLLIDLDNKEINFVAFSKVTHMDIINQNITYLGIRFKPGAFYNIYHIPSFKVMDTSIPFKDESFNQTIFFNLSNIKDQITYLDTYLATKTNTISKYQTLVDDIYQLDDSLKVNEVASLLNYSPSHANKLFKLHYGYNIKTLLNIIRLHKTLTYLIDEKYALNDIVYLLNYYDLSHLSNEIIKYTKINPSKLLKIR